MALHYTTDPVCPLCEDKLKHAHEKLQHWFRAMKVHFSDIHISCSYRGELDQNKAFADGLSRARFPLSKHNHTDGDGVPCARALDLFQLKDCAAYFDAHYLKAVADHPLTANAEIRWGGSFRTIMDSVHFEV